MKRLLPISFALLVAGCGSQAPRDGGLSDMDNVIDMAIAPDLIIPSDMTVSGPMRLSETGLYSDFASRTLAPGIITFAPRYPLWSDGADKERYLLLPPGSQIDTSDMDNWVFPVGTKLWKQFTVAVPSPDGGAGGDGGSTSVVVETRLLEKIYAEPSRTPPLLSLKGWWAIAYIWSADGSDAVAAPDGMDNVLGTTHYVPSQDECDQCHGSLKDLPIGASAIQLGAPDGDGTLAKLAAMGMLTNAPAPEYAVPGQGVVQEALGYLHGNCGHCHSTTAPQAQFVKLYMRLGVLQTSPYMTGAYAAINFKANHVYEPGDVAYDIVGGNPDKSQLYVRMGLRDGWQMPPICTKVADPAGLATVRDWILTLPTPRAGADPVCLKRPYGTPGCPDEARRR